MTRYALENSSACSFQNSLVVVKPWTKTNGNPCPEMRTNVSPIVTSRVGLTVVAVVIAALLRRLLLVCAIAQLQMLFGNLGRWVRQVLRKLRNRIGHALAVGRVGLCAIGNVPLLDVQPGV